MYNCGCDDCKDKTSQLNLSIGDSFKQLLNVGKNAFKRLHEIGSYKPQDLKNEKAYQDLINKTFDVFNFAITDNDMPNEMRTALQSDAFLFGGLKTHAQLFEASKLLLDDNGNLKPFKQLSNEFDKLNSIYNRTYLEAEYEFAVGSSQMAAKWSEFSDNDRYYLQYRTAGDTKVRQDHQALHNTTLPKNDPFWSSYTPPNGWNCRCTVVEVLKDKYPVSNSVEKITAGEKATTQIGKDGKNRLEIFRFNPGADKKLFPPKHPNNLIAGAKAAKPIILTIFNKPIGEFETIKKFKNGGEVYRHRLVNKKDNDYNDIKNSCTHFAKQGFKTEILPRVHHKSEEYKNIYADLIGTKYEGKCPDFRVEGKYYEVEGHETLNMKKALKNMLNRGEKQSSNIVILDTGLQSSYIIRAIKNKIINDNSIIDEVYNLKNKKLELIYKNTKTP